MKYKILGYIFIIVAGLAVVSLIYYWQTPKGIQSNVRIPIHQDATANWKTYTNTQYGFEFKYPNNWAETGGSIGGNKAPFKIILSSPEKKDTPMGKLDTDSIEVAAYPTITDILNDYLDPNKIAATNLLDFLTKAKAVHAIDVGDFQAIQFNGLPAFGVILTGESSYYSIFLESNNLIYEILFPQAKNSTLLTAADNQILSTFKFTK
jgi:hypothetical protein